jgi:hypothetical protein
VNGAIIMTYRGIMHNIRAINTNHRSKIVTLVPFQGMSKRIIFSVKGRKMKKQETNDVLATGGITVHTSKKSRNPPIPHSHNFHSSTGIINKG